MAYQNVGQYNNAAGQAAATYLGNRYVLIANHAGLPNGTGISFPGVAGTFPLDGTTDSRLKNADNSDSDLRLVRLAANPGLSAVPIASTSPAIGAALTLIGDGVQRLASPTYYNVISNGSGGFNWTETSSSGTANAGGFKLQGNATLAYGTNTNDGDGGTGSNFLLASGLNVRVFQTDFYESGTTGNATAAKNDFLTQQAANNQTPEGQATVGDSGGGVFGPGGVLVGIIEANDAFTDQPPNTSIFGSHTYIADLSVYRSQLPTDLPEPASALSAVAAAGLLAARRRRRPGC